MRILVEWVESPELVLLVICALIGIYAEVALMSLR